MKLKLTELKLVYMIERAAVLLYDKGKTAEQIDAEIRRLCQRQGWGVWFHSGLDFGVYPLSPAG